MDYQQVIAFFLGAGLGSGALWFYFYWTNGGAKSDMLDLKAAIKEALEEAEDEVDELGDKFELAADKLIKKIFG